MDKFCLTGRIRRAAASSSTVARRAAGLQACAFALAWQHHGTRLLAAMHSWRLRQAHGDIGAKFTHGNEEDPTIPHASHCPVGPAYCFFWPRWPLAYWNWVDSITLRIQQLGARRGSGVLHCRRSAGGCGMCQAAPGRLRRIHKCAIGDQS